MNSNNNITGKIVIQGDIETFSPLHIGCGFGERSDLDVLLDSEGKPFIPATSLIGILQHAISSENPDFNENAKLFWGFTDDKIGKQSAVKCSDLTAKSKTMCAIRDGIKIDNRTGIVEHTGKYDYEILESGAKFSLNMEMEYNQSSENFVKNMAATIFTILANGKLRIGAKTNSGFGAIKLLKDKAKVYLFDFSDKKDVYHWLVQDFSNKKAINPGEIGAGFEIADSRFCIDASFELKSSIIIRSYPVEPEMPDAVHIHSNNNPVLTGTSIKGAVRARAERIVKTLGKSDEFVKTLFGYVDKDKTRRAKKGKVRVNEFIMPKFVSEIQNRIKIDRFTGGTIESALFDSMPLFVDDSKKVIKIIIDVPNCSESEAGLLLLVLKDLWTGDLALGGEKNVGRGVFKGIKALIEWNKDFFVIEDEIKKLPDSDREVLENFVKSFVSEECS